MLNCSANCSISAVRPPCYYLLEEIVIVGVIYGSLVWMVCNPGASCNPPLQNNLYFKIIQKNILRSSPHKMSNHKYTNVQCMSTRTSGAKVQATIPVKGGEELIIAVGGAGFGLGIPPRGVNGNPNPNCYGLVRTVLCHSHTQRVQSLAIFWKPCEPCTIGPNFPILERFRACYVPRLAASHALRTAFPEAVDALHGSYRGS